MESRHDVDLAVVGAGAAGLAAAIFAGEAAGGSPLRITLLDGARKPGAKILVSGGGRCNVTNERVTPEDFWGGPRPLIRSVLKAFNEGRTIAWMQSLGVPLKLEQSGKYFPVSNSARTVLDALLRRARELGVELRPGCRVAGVHRDGPGFTVRVRDAEPVRASRVIVATGGLSLPKSGSDGAGLDWMRRLGHTIIPTTPALAPLVLSAGTDLGGRFAEFAGISLNARIRLLDARKRVVASQTEPLLFTHFGISGPGPMNLSRHIRRLQIDQPGEPWTVCLSPDSIADSAAADAWLQRRIQSNPREQTWRALTELFPERLARAASGRHEDSRLAELGREARLSLAATIGALPLPVTGDRGYPFAETTAGGVDLREVDIRTMASRIAPGLHLCGEMLDADGRIGGFNFQWAWATGYLAGRGAVAALRAHGQSS